MPRNYLDPPRPIAALATARGDAALSILRTSGPGCIELVAGCFSRPHALEKAPGHSLVYGYLLDPRTKERIDEVLVSVFRAPSSPTGEDQAEISLHGSAAIIRRALEALERAGFAEALPGEFTFRSFVNGKTDLVRAEALNDLVRSRSEGGRAEALSLLSGSLSGRLENARTELIETMASVELRLDYGEDEVGEIFDDSALQALRRELKALSDSFAVGRIYRDGLKAVLAGPVNAGKSSLFNLLLREERSIVSPEPGTTRDYIEGQIEIAGVELRLFDTAGLRDSPDMVEAEGVARSRRILSDADIVIYLVDATEETALSDAALPPGAIVVLNKIDLLSGARKGGVSGRPSGFPKGWIPLSAATGEGLPALIAALEKAVERLTGGGASCTAAQTDASVGTCSAAAIEGIPDGGAAAQSIPGSASELRLASERQKTLIDRCLASLDLALADSAAGTLDALALDLREAADALGEITGEIATPEVLETIFSRFCVGK